jgi:hypothetical protein
MILSCILVTRHEHIHSVIQSNRILKCDINNFTVRVPCTAEDLTPYIKIVNRFNKYHFTHIRGWIPSSSYKQVQTFHGHLYRIPLLKWAILNNRRVLIFVDWFIALRFIATGVLPAAKRIQILPIASNVWD